MRFTSCQRLVKKVWKFESTLHTIQMRIMGARRNFSRGGKTAWIGKMAYFSALRRRKRKCLRFFRRFRQTLRVLDASAEGSSENFRVVCTERAYDVIVFKFQGLGNCPRLSPPSGRPWWARLVFAFVDGSYNINSHPLKIQWCHMFAKNHVESVI